MWLNTPQAPLGTSGMKAALNGVPSLSILDGWWIQGCVEGITGWAIGDGGNHSATDDAASLYEKLEHVVLPGYYGERPAWIAIMKGAIAKCGSLFNSHHVMRRYGVEAYLE